MAGKRKKIGLLSKKKKSVERKKKKIRKRERKKKLPATPKNKQWRLEILPEADEAKKEKERKKKRERERERERASLWNWNETQDETKAACESSSGLFFDVEERKKGPKKVRVVG